MFQEVRKLLIIIKQLNKAKWLGRSLKITQSTKQKKTSEYFVNQMDEAKDLFL